MNNIIEKLDKGLVVSCQALEGEPLHSSFIMGRMAKAAVEGGAVGIRANSAKDIEEIKTQVDVPIIGIIKQDFDDSDVYITPTLTEAKDLLDVQPDIIAMDATKQKRPHGERLEEIVKHIKCKAPQTLVMADISTINEAIEAEKLGFDLISTTLIGYTSYTKGQSLFDNDFKIIKELSNKVHVPVVAEGKISSPQLAEGALQAGASFVVVGGAITRPQQITKTFTEKI